MNGGLKVARYGKVAKYMEVCLWSEPIVAVSDSDVHFWPDTQWPSPDGGYPTNRTASILVVNVDTPSAMDT
jgi:hypothetical protein